MELRATRGAAVTWALGLVALLWLALAPAAAQPRFPALTGRVVDTANVLPPDVETSLEAKLRQFEAETTHQFVIATVPDLQGYDIADYGYQLGRTWGIGDKVRNDGILLIVAPNDRRVRIEAGYGLEGDLPDALAALIIANAIVPRFKAADIPGGVVAGADAVIAQLSLPPEQARANADRARAQAAASREGDGPGIGGGLILLFIFLFFILPLLTSGGRRGRRGGVPVIFWPGGFGGGGGGGDFGGGFGGGGFGGGGGSFGGGGASGSW